MKIKLISIGWLVFMAKQSTFIKRGDKMHIKFVEVTQNNLEIAVSLQNKIFPGEDGRENYIEGITNDPYRKEMVNYIIYDDIIPVGVVGLYSYNEYPLDSWLSWFGILNEFRNKGYGSYAFDFFENISRDKGYENIRVYTDNGFDKAISLYKSKGMIEERYSNELESDEINNETIIFSKSLIKNKTNLWNNKFLQLTAQSEKEK